MGFFAFDGNNKIFDDLVAQLPNGLVYFKEKNIIPANDVVTYIETFSEDYAVGTSVNIYVNNNLYDTKTILPTRSIYLKLKPPYGKFSIKTEINNQPYREETYYALNIFSFLNALSLEFNYDYVELFKMFGNVWDKYLQNDMLYNKIGWFYDFGKPYGWTFEDYKKILSGSADNIQIHHLFMNSMTYWSLKELVKSFTGVYPEIFTYRDMNGWIIPETIRYNTVAETLPPYWEYKDFYLWDERKITGTTNVSSGVDLNGLTLKVQAQSTIHDITFTTTTNITDIINQINAVVGFSFAHDASTHTENPQPGHLMLALGGVFNSTDGGVIIIKGGTALSSLGLQTSSDDDFIDADNEIITLYDENFYGNKIDLTIRNGSKEVEVTKTRSNDIQDFLLNKDIINNPTHPFVVSGYTIGVDFDLVEYPSAGSNDWAIEWLNPATNMTGTVDGASGFDVKGKTLTLNINNEEKTITFLGTDPISITDVVAQINDRFTGTPASVHTVGTSEYVRFSGYGIKIISGTAVSTLGFTVDQQVGVPLVGDQYIVIYSYFIKEDIIPLCEQIKPAFLKINYYFTETI